MAHRYLTAFTIVKGLVSGLPFLVLVLVLAREWHGDHLRSVGAVYYHERPALEPVMWVAIVSHALYLVVVLGRAVVSARWTADSSSDEEPLVVVRESSSRDKQKRVSRRMLIRLLLRAADVDKLVEILHVEKSDRWHMPMQRKACACARAHVHSRHTCMHVLAHVHAHTRTHVCMHAHTCTLAHMHTCTHARMHTCACRVRRKTMPHANKPSTSDGERSQGNQITRRKSRIVEAHKPSAHGRIEASDNTIV